MKTYKLLATLLVLPFAFVLNAQTQGIAYTAEGKGVATTFLTDYHSLGINSSALGWGTGHDNKKFTVGTSEFSFGMMSPTLDKQRLKNAFQGIKAQLGGNAGNFDYQQQLDAVGDYAEAGLGINVRYNWFGASFQGEKFGGIAVSISENYDWYSQLNEKTTDILFRGKFSNLFDSLTVVMNGDTTIIGNSNNISQDTLDAVVNGFRTTPLLASELTNGSKIKFLWNRTYNFGYGRKIFGDNEKFALYGGVGFRYIQSMAMFDMESDSDGLRVNTALSPFFGISQDAQAQTGSRRGFPESVGNGYGLDFSASVIMFDKIRIAAAVNNIGQVVYKRNAYTIRDTLIGSSSQNGLGSANIPGSIDEFADIGGILQSEGEEKITILNPATFRLGGSISFLEDMIHVGVDVVAPFNKSHPGSLRNAVVSVGGEFRPLKWLHISLGYFGGGVYKHNMPVGINFVIGGGTYEFGIASRDAISFFYKDAHSLSMAMGVMRFRF